MKKYLPLRLGKGRISFLVDTKAALIVLILLLITVTGFVFSAGAGEVIIGPVDTLKTILGFGDPMNQLIIQSFRLPRIVIALLVGISLAVAGAILQNLVRNPLASPDVIGITGGASVAVVLFLTLFSDSNHSLTVSLNWMPAAAFVGAMITAFTVYFLSWKNGASSFRLILIGIGMSMLAQSLTTLFMIKGPIYQAAQANVWITGSIYAADWKQVQILWPVTLILMLLSILLMRNINIQEFGDEIAVGVGSPVEWNRFALLLLSAALIASAVSFSGMIGFVGLMAPHMARRLVGSGFGALLPVSALIGGLLVMLADLAGRTLFLPLEVPAGVFTATIGAPYFIYLLYKSRNS
ncbi:FecCD family ABC transporter permease [Kroppenstedtia eburnea]|uniref:Iron complex transport system permease protein n=1 Tax=Kroppenstedtia eburnea TaxID=714067 RepID=A0A1N7LAV7_9BACL|nr:iron ABC transporter permease [Kroppenstedtia eburnea]EGK07542.1 ferrichrome ABC superfamily ATP binding cassette transporter permease protein [Desmospora sp. 8437]QKI81442.1 iron ABC transporter permease [Kroppenstedtia eburnea]SIS70924.1 iron complex transport system permease protein [Kroppenstedtia eburnea]